MGYAAWFTAFQKSRAGRSAIALLDRTFAGGQDADALKDEVLRACHALATWHKRDPRGEREREKAKAYVKAVEDIAHHANALSRLLRDNRYRGCLDLHPSAVRITSVLPRPRVHEEFDDLSEWMLDAADFLDELASKKTGPQYPVYAFASFRDLNARKPPESRTLLALRLVFIFRAHSTGNDYRAGPMPATSAGNNVGDPRRPLVAALVRAAFGTPYTQAHVLESEGLNRPSLDRFRFRPIPR